MAKTDDDLVPETTSSIRKATSDEEAREAEAALLEQTDNGPQPDDPPDQPSGGAASVGGAASLEGLPAKAREVIDTASKEVGKTEVPVNKTGYGRWYGLDGQPWCAMFVSWCFDQVGFPQPASTTKGFAFTPAGADWYKRLGRWGTTPKPGAVVFFKFAGGPNRIHHVGLVAGVQGSVVETIEGNTSAGTAGSQREGGGVFRRRRSSGIVGYGYPAYEGQAEQVFKIAQVDEGTKERIKELQRLLGVADDGDFGPKTAEACNQHPIGFQEEVNRKNPSRPVMENRPDLVKFLKRQMNRRFGFGLDESSDAVGAKVNHGIVVGLGQADSICGKSGYLTAVG